MTEELNYEQDVRIQEHALDVEWLAQPNLMRKYAVYSAHTRKILDEAKERLDVGSAKLQMDIRTNPEKYGLGKVTEAAIESARVLQPEYQKLVQKHIDARYEHEVAVAVVRAVDQKKTALENLVKLLGVSYFAGPKAPRDLSEEWVAQTKRRAGNAQVKIRQGQGRKGE